MKRTWLIAIGIFLISGLVTADSKPRKPARIAQGEWGGQHVRMSVSDSTATLDFDCANGQINGPLTIDRRGRFDLKGAFNREHPGPIRRDEESNGTPARYTGWTDGQKMTLTITVAGEKQAVGTFNLTHGGPGRVFKCK